MKREFLRFRSTHLQSDTAAEPLYQAFISYSHKGEGRVASALQSGMQKFAKPWYQRRSMEIFRDETGLAMTHELWPAIMQSLARSQHFLLLASPEAATSEWVEKEVIWWLEERSIDNLHLILTDGQIVWNEPSNHFDPHLTTALPAPLLDVYKNEPAYLDLRWPKVNSDLTLDNNEFRAAVRAAVASVRGITPEQVFSEEQLALSKNMTIAAVTILCLLGLTLALGITVRQVSYKRVEADAGRIAAISQATADEFPRRSLLLATEATAMTKHLDTPLPSALQSMRNVLATTSGLPLNGHDSPVESVSVSRNGAVMATLDRSGFTQLWDLRAQDPALKGTAVDIPSSAHSAIAFGMLPTTLAVGDTEGDVYLVHIGESTETATFTHIGNLGGPIRFIALGANAVIAKVDNTIYYRLLANVSEKKNLVLIPNDVEQGNFALSSSKDTLAVLVGDRIKIWSLAPELNFIRSLELNKVNGSFQSLAISSDRRWVGLGTGGNNPGENSTILWDLKAPSSSRTVTTHSRAVSSIAFSRNSQKMVIGSWDKSINVLQLPPKNVAANIELTGHQHPINSVAFFNNGTHVVSTSNDKTVRLWDLSDNSTSESSATLRGHDYFTRFAEVITGDQWLVSSAFNFTVDDSDATARLWDIRKIEPTTLNIVMSGHSSPVTTLDATNTSLLSGGNDKAPRLWSRESFQKYPTSSTLTGHHTSINSVAISQNNKWLASIDSNGVLLIWDSSSINSPAFRLTDDDDSISMLRFSDNGKWLVAAGSSELRLWDLSHGAPIEQAPIKGFENISDVRLVNGTLFIANQDTVVLVRELRGIRKRSILRKFNVEEYVTAVTLSPNGRQVALGLRNGSVHLFDLSIKRGLPLVFNGHEGAVLKISISTQSNWLLTASGDNTDYSNAAKLWNLTVKDPTQSMVDLHGHTTRVRAVTFSPDERFAFTASTAGTIRKWPLDPVALRMQARRIAGREISRDEREIYFHK